MKMTKTTLPLPKGGIHNKVPIAERVYHKEFSGVDHMQILKDNGVITYVTEAVKKINQII